MTSSDETLEELRLRQVHQYLSFNPSGYSSRKTTHDISATKVTSPNTALTAFVQLVALRLNAQRAIISLVDRDNQYFLAESTPTLDLQDGEQSDWLWMGCSGFTPRSQALCAQTITAQSPEKGYSSYCVLDLAKHPDFRNLSYVNDSPKFRFYAGTPLISIDGFRIGSLFVIDDRPRESNLKESEINFLGLMATNVMKYMEMQKEAHERKRIATMSKGLAAFTEGRHRIPTEWKAPSDTQTGTSNDHAKNIDLQQYEPTAGDEEDVTNEITGKFRSEKIREVSPKLSVEPHRVFDVNGKAQTHSSILAKASNLLRESLDVDYTVFLDVNPELGPNSFSQDPGEGIPSDNQPGSAAHSTRSKLARVVSFSTRMASSSSQDDMTSAGFRIMSLRMVKRLVKLYPKGYLWSFDENERVVQAEDEPLELDNDSAVTTSSSDSEGDRGHSKDDRIKEFKAITACFPGVRQILFAPIFDPATFDCICASFAVSLHEVPVFTTDIEVAFARAFLNNVAVEWDRVTVSIADRTKSDFLSSISHEFRSPLHGILASTELLSDSELDTSQRGLCDTILMCGSTLLNTVSHILDYSMVNDLSYRRPSSNRASEPQSGSGTLTPSEGTSVEILSKIGLYSDVDVAWICEAVVQTVCAGFAHDHKTPGSQVLHSYSPVGGIESSGNLQTPHVVTQPVIVILDVFPGDWIFATAPGAIQRVLMNLVGNSLKYTNAGYVRIEVKMEPNTYLKVNGETRSVTITVSDTGIGISEDFLRHKLYAPFSQESTLAPGTGLGLSMVKKIVHALRGEIGIQSQQNKGTQVTVRIPLLAAGQQNPPSMTTSLDLKITKNPISILRAECVNKRVILYGLGTPATTMLRKSIEIYITQWYGFQIVEDPHDADFTIVDENALESCLSRFRGDVLPPRVVVLRYSPIKHTGLAVETHDVLKPIGPYRLAKGLYSSWIDNSTSPIQNSTNPPTREAFEQGNHAGGERKSHLVMSNNSETSTIEDNSPGVSNDTAPETMNKSINTSLPLRPQRQASQASAHSRPIRSSQPEILCVDDNQINLKLLQAYLQKLGYTNIHCAENGLEAFNMVETSNSGFNLIFMDLSMPICDGFESTKMIRKLEKQRNKQSDTSESGSVPAWIIALTGQASSRDQNEAFASGIDSFVTKPMSLVRLQELLAEWEAKGAFDAVKPP